MNSFQKWVPFGSMTILDPSAWFTSNYQIFHRSDLGSHAIFPNMQHVYATRLHFSMLPHLTLAEEYLPKIHSL